MTRKLTDPIGLAKAILWEECKGKLRAIVVAEGAQVGEIDEHGRYSFQRIEDEVEAFIRDFEARGYHE